MIKRLVIVVMCFASLFGIAEIVHKHIEASKPPSLTESEKDKLDLNTLKIKTTVDEINKQIVTVMQPLQDDRKKLLEDIKKNHPGYEWHDATKQGEVSGFIPIVRPVKK